MNEKKESDDYAGYIGRKVYTKTWRGDFWGPDGAILWSRLQFDHLRSKKREGNGASALSSTYYAAWGNAVSKMVQARGRSKFLWLARAISCAIMALAWSHIAEKKIGFENMTHGQHDVRASILAKWHMYQDAEKHLSEALKKTDITNDSRALILCKLGEVLDKKPLDRKGGKNAGVFIGDAKLLIDQREVKDTTRVRVLKALGAHMLRQKRNRPLDYRDKALMFLEQALKIAEKENLGDQILKIKTLMKKAE